MPQNAIIRADGTGDYTTIIAWEAAEQSADYGAVTVGRVDGFFDQGTAGLNIGGTWPNGAKLEAFNSADAFDGTERQLCGLTTSNGQGLRLQLTTSFATDGLEIYGTAASGTSRAYRDDQSASVRDIKNTLIKSTNGRICQNGTGFVNSVLVTLGGGSGVFFGTVDLNNSSIFTNVNVDNIPTSATNCVSYNAGTGADWGGATTQTNCASVDATATAFPSIVIADEFIDLTPITSGDYRIKSGGTLATNSIGAFIQVSGGITALNQSYFNKLIGRNDMKKNIAGQSIGAQMITISDGSNFTGSVSVFVTIDNGTQAAGGGSVVHEGNGYHSYSPTQAETNGDHVSFTFTGTGAFSSNTQVYTNFPQSVDNNTEILANGTAIGNLNDIAPTDIVTSGAIVTSSGAIVNVINCAANADMRGTDGANTVSPDNATITLIDAKVDAIGSITTDTNSRVVGIELDYSKFNPLTDVVANVTLVDTTTTNTDMRGTDNASTITANDVLQAGDIDSYSLEESQKLILSASVGVLAGAATNSITIEAADNSKTRITATVDVDGNRTSVTKDVTG